MSVAALPGGMLRASSRLRPLPLSLVGWCVSCDNDNYNNNNNNNDKDNDIDNDNNCLKRMNETSHLWYEKYSKYVCFKQVESSIYGQAL